MTESTLQVALLLAAPSRLPALRLFRRNVLAARVGERTVRAGIKGQADLYAYVRGGSVIEIELKAAGKLLSPEQKTWQTWCREWGVPHLVLRAEKGETVEGTVERWIGEISAALNLH
jgi:hypothetical protein